MTSAHTSSLWSPLLPPALVGVQRQQANALPLPGAAGAFSQALAAATADPAEHLLRQAAMLAVCQQTFGAATLPQTSTLPAAMASESRPVLGDASHQPLLHELHWLLSDTLAPLPLAHESLHQLGLRQWCLPPALLPAALQMGRQHVVLRPAVLSVLGERGRWLARQSRLQSPAPWGYAAQETQAQDAQTQDAQAQGADLWHTGTLAQRQDWLRTLRQGDAQQCTQARAALQAAWPDLPAAERAALAAVLANGLSLADETVLQTWLSDRSREVRGIVADLLTALPESAYARQMGQRMATLIPTAQAVAAALPTAMDAPQQPEPDWKTCALDTPRPKNESLGERAWWLYQIVRQTPLHWWHSHTGAAAQDLLHWAAQTDWHEALVRGWLHALQATARAPTGHATSQALVQQWALALLRSPRGPHLQGHDSLARGQLLALLPRPEREPFWIETLNQIREAPARAQVQHLAPLCEDMLAACTPGETLSQPLASDLLETLFKLFAEQALHHNGATSAGWSSLRQCLPSLPSLLPLDLLPTVAQWPRHADESASTREHLDACQRAARARLLLWQFLQTQASHP